VDVEASLKFSRGGQPTPAEVMVIPDDIWTAVDENDLAAIQKWLSTGKRDDLDDKAFHCDGMTLLLLATYRGQCDMMRELLAHGASPEETTNFGETALHVAASRGQNEAAVLLLDHGAEIEARTIEKDDLEETEPLVWGFTPLMVAGESGHCDMIRLLLSRGATLDARSDDGHDAEIEALLARTEESRQAGRLLGRIRLAGGWKPFVRLPRKRLFALRKLCSEGRATTDDRLLEFVFGPNAENPAPKGVDAAIFEKLSAGARAQIRAVSRVVYPSSQHKKPRGPARAHLPKEIFWLILEYWRCDRDSRY